MSFLLIVAVKTSTMRFFVERPETIHLVEPKDYRDESRE